MTPEEITALVQSLIDEAYGNIYVTININHDGSKVTSIQKGQPKDPPPPPPGGSGNLP